MWQNISADNQKTIKKKERKELPVFGNSFMKGKTIMFKKYNPNPAGRKGADCVIRALTVVTGKDWDTIYRDLTEIGFELKALPDEKPVWEKYLADNGYRRVGIKVEKGGRRPTVFSFARMHLHGVFFVQVAQHVVGIKDGFYHDSWDSGRRSLYAYWVKEGEEE